MNGHNKNGWHLDVVVVDVDDDDGMEYENLFDGDIFNIIIIIIGNWELSKIW